MTETQAKSGTASAEDEQARADAPADPAGPSGASESAADSDSGAPAAGKDPGAIGRASVPGETTTGGSPKYTRAPGMAPPPDSLTVPIQVPTTGTGRSGTGSPPPVSLPVGGVPVHPTSGGPAVARATVPRGASASATQTVGLRGPAASGSARVTEAVRAARKTVTAAVGRGPRRARLHVKRIDPWSVMKFSFAVAFVLFVVVIVATSVLWLALDAMDVFDSVNKTLADMVGATGGESNESFKITAKGVIGGAALLGLVNVVLFTALATLGAFIYNVCADLVGGIELTLAEKD